MQLLFPSGMNIDCPVNHPHLYSQVAKLPFGCDFHEGKTDCRTRAGGKPEMHLFPCNEYSQETCWDPAFLVAPPFSSDIRPLLG